MQRRRPQHPRRQGSATIVVLWSIAIAAVVVAATQFVTWRTAALGHATLGRVQARWAARAGMERIIATLAYHSEAPDPDDPMAVLRDLEFDWQGTLESGGWDIRHAEEGLELKGPLDLHSRLNINAAQKGQLLLVPDMSIDTVDAILDWRDDDDEVQGIGAERSFYEGRDLQYIPRNGPFKSIAELELVAGAWPEFVRGEDWNLNDRLDAGENDGDLSAPEDDADGTLDPGWAGYLTARSIDSPRGLSGLPRIDLRRTSTEELVEVLGVDEAQAGALIQYASNDSAPLGSLLAVDLGELVGAPSAGPASRSSGRSTAGRNTGNTINTQQPAVEPLSKDQLRAIFAECTTSDFGGIDPLPGRVNLNTAGPEVLRILFDDPGVAESILALRQSRAEGITSIVDLLDLRRVDPSVLAGIADLLDVTGWTFSVTSRGRSNTGQEVEIHAVLDRSNLPVRILEYRED
jgi:type II secretory pathway component PulK